MLSWRLQLLLLKFLYIYKYKFYLFKYAVSYIFKVNYMFEGFVLKIPLGVLGTIDLMHPFC